MVECFNIFLLFLIPHASHVLQAVEVAVFGLSKPRIAKMSVIAYSTPLGNITFLICYHKARLSGITGKNIIAGLKLSGF